MKNKKNSMIKTLTKRSFISNKGRNLVAVMAIILTTLMFTTLFVLAQSMSKTMTDMAFRQSGFKAHASTKSITDEQIELIAAHPDVKSYGKSIVAGIGMNEELLGRQVEVRYADEGYVNNSFAQPATGRLPQSVDEIALDDITLSRLGIPQELGQKVTIEWTKDFSTNEVITSEFTLCGFWEANTSIYASMAWVSEDFVMEQHEAAEDEIISDSSIFGLRMMEITFKNDINIEASIEKVLDDTGIDDVEFGVNLAYSQELNAGADLQSLPMYGSMILVFFSGYLIIYNVFQISVTADIQFYGKLKTLGTSKKQIKKLLYGQANLLCLIGIPIGLISGYFLGRVLLPMMISSNVGEMSISSSPVIFIGSAVFAWLTVRISCARPARIAGKVSPMEALRYSDVDSGNKRKSKKVKGSASLSGMALSNMGRNQKRTIMLICSLTLGLVLLACFYAKNESFDMDQYLSSLAIADYQVNEVTNAYQMGNYNPQGTTISNELIDRIESLGGIEETGRLYTRDIIIPVDEQLINNIEIFYSQDSDRRQWMESATDFMDGLRQAKETKEAMIRVSGVDGIALNALCAEDNIMDGTFDREKFATGKYLLCKGPAVSGEKEIWPTFAVGDKVMINNTEYEIMALIWSINPVDEGYSQSSLDLEVYMPADTFMQIYPENTLRKFYWNIGEENLEAYEEMLEDYRKNVDPQLILESRATIERQYEEETRASSIIGNAISIVIAMVGILNFVNSMVTAIISRRKEFAMIQSVGMTKSQLLKMITYEGLYYALITLAAAYTISSLVIATLIRAMVEGGFTTYQFTLFPLVISTPLLLILAVIIPYICFKSIEKQSIIERLRIS